MTQTLHPDDLEIIATVAHEMNRTYCRSIGDDSQPIWDEAPDWQKASAIAGIQHVIANPDTTPEMSHMSWLAQKEKDGWKFGPVKDPIGKFHPCYRPYAELPASQRIKDVIFITTVKTLLDVCSRLQKMELQLTQDADVA